MKKSSFVYGSILMTAMNFIIAFIGFSYDVLLSNLIGAEAMGLFQMSMSVLMIFMIITTAGVPMAVSQLVAQENSKNHKENVYQILKFSIILNFILSIVLSFILVCLSNPISEKIFKNRNMLQSIYFLVPIIIIISINSVIRGYYYGLKKVGVASVSEIINNVSRFLIVLGFLHYSYPVELEFGVLVAICGISIGEFFGLIWLILAYKRQNKKSSYPCYIQLNSIDILNQIIKIAGPLTITGLINVFLGFVNKILIPNKLMDLGYSNSEAYATLGRITGMAMSLIFMPFVITSALVINIVPSLSEQMALKNYRNMKADILFAIKITLIISIPLSILYRLFSEPLAVFLYNDKKVGEYLRILSYSTVFMALQHTFSGILQGLNKHTAITINRLIGMSIQLLLVYFLVGNPKFGINGFFIGFYLRIFVIFLLDLVTLRSIVKFRFRHIN